ncbi:alpha/beta fold hydrolase [Nocardia sp. NPDC004068]|uniref:alpha/beta fold hydrolase n=1 Tax=Nocardia sp. NPDC004068 TaxID=3364303 RepID=UPI0036BA57E4
MHEFTNGSLVFEVTDVQPAAPNGETVILLHGFPEDRWSWSGLIPGLTSAGFRSLAPDLRGYSPRARPAARSAYTLRKLAEDVLALADAARAERVHLVGQDWGAALAWYLAARRPDRVRSLTALSVPHPYAFMRAMVTSPQILRSWYMIANQLPWLPELALSVKDQTVRALIRSGLDAESAARYAQRTDMRGPVNWYRAMPLSLTRPVGSVAVPTLYIRGAEDRYITRAAAESCRRYVRGAYRFVTLSGAGHWLPERDWDRIGPLLGEHLGGVVGRLDTSA